MANPEEYTDVRFEMMLGGACLLWFFSDLKGGWVGLALALVLLSSAVFRVYVFVQQMKAEEEPPPGSEDETLAVVRCATCGKGIWSKETWSGWDMGLTCLVCGASKGSPLPTNPLPTKEKPPEPEEKK